MVHRADSVFLEHHDSEIALLRRLLHLTADGEWEKIVPRKDCDAFDLWIALGDDVGERFRQRVVRCEGSEQILVALIIDLFG